MDFKTRALVADLADYVRDNDDTIANALHNHIRHMREAAAQARAAYEAGRADPEVRAKQDASYVTNYGLFQSARRFTEDADSTQRIADRLAELIDKYRDIE